MDASPSSSPSPSTTTRRCSHPTGTLPTLVPFCALTSTNSTAGDGPSRYFAGLAAGEDLTGLIGGLRSSMWHCYQSCLQTGAESGGKLLSVSSRASSSDTLNPSLQRGVYSGKASGDVQEHEDAMAPAAPHELPRGTLSLATRQAYWKATKSVFLLAAESPAAAEAATALHCSAVTRSLLYANYHPFSGDAAKKASTSVLPRLSHHHDPEALRWILSDHQVADLAREEMRRDLRGGWRTALHLLDQVVPSPLTMAVELEVYRRLGAQGVHGAAALRCLWRLPGRKWTEMDVSTVLRCLYRAGRAMVVPKDNKAASLAPELSSDHHFNTATGAKEKVLNGDHSLASLIGDAMKMHAAVEEAGVLQWSAPFALNDTLGLLACRPASWETACALLDKVIATAVAGPTELELEADVAEQSGDEAAATQEKQKPTPPSALFTYRHLRPNAVTLYQACQALQEHPVLGLGYLQKLQSAYGDSIDLFSDIAATESALRLCIAGQLWREALQLVTAHQRHLKTTQQATVPMSSSSVRAELSGPRRHYRPDLFVQLIRLLCTAAEARAIADDLVMGHAANTGPTRDGPASRSLSGDSRPREAVDLSASAHYNGNTISRAYNCLIQSTDSLEAADALIWRLRGSEQRTALSIASANDPPGSAGTAQDGLMARNAALYRLETESVAHIAFLASVAGDWQRALHHTQALLHRPRYASTFLPTARLHDAVQYALETAPTPGPPWQVSVQLYTDMMARHVPSSEVSFQSVVKRCFAGGAADEAQRLFYLAMHRGVRP